MFLPALRTMKITPLKTLLALSLLALGSPAARASVAYGSINNFDTVNDTGHECHGFEIEIEDVHSTDISYTYNWNHYGVPKITEDNSVPAHPKCKIRWESAKKPDGTWAAFTAIPSGPIAPTQGHSFTNPGVNFGGEHFGAGYRKPATAVKYHWLLDDGAGALVLGPAVDVATPAFLYYPRVAGAAAQVQAVIRPAPQPPVLEFGKAIWVKEIRTTTHNANEVKLRDLVSDDPAFPPAKDWRNGEPDEVEIEWQILQTEFAALAGGVNGELAGAPEDLPGGDEVVTRRYEFYKYTGPLDVVGEAMGDAVAADGIHGVGTKLIDGVEVDLSVREVVGLFLGAQMSAVDVNGKLGLIDHLQDGRINTAYAARTVVLAGNAPFTATSGGALPAGMNFDAVTGIVSGTPTASGVFTFTVDATDGASADVVKKYTFTIAAAGVNLPAHSLVDTSASPIGSGATTGDGSYATGANATVSATPNAGFVFINWTDNGTVVSNVASYTLVVEVNHALVANFGATRTITTVASPVAGGSTSGGGTFPGSTNATVLATANAGYVFTNWTSGGSVASTTASYTFSVTANKTLVANFVSAGTQQTIATSANPSAGGTVSGGGNYASGQSATLLATPNPFYKFSKWQEGGATVSTTASYTFTAAGNRALVAVFLKIPALNFTRAASAGSLLLAWPADATGWVLQESADFAMWQDSTRAITTSGAQKSVTMPVASGCCFFRLAHP